MNAANAHSLTNDFRDVRLYSLHHWPEAARFRTSEGHGPFVVLQSAIDPQDFQAQVDDFILGKSGRWLPFYLFHQLPGDVRRAEYVFPAAADVIAVLQGLTGKPVIERGQPSAEPAEPLTEDSLRHAIDAARQAGAGEIPTAAS